MRFIFNIFDKKKAKPDTLYYLKIGQRGEQDIYVKDARINDNTTGFQQATTDLSEAKPFRDSKTAKEFGDKNTFTGFKIVKKIGWLYTK